MPLTSNSKTSRWYKKQLLDRSDRELEARMKREGHSFVRATSHFAAHIGNVMRHSKVALRSSSLSGLVSSTEMVTRVTATPTVLATMGFRDFGNGFWKLGHSVWALESDGNDIALRRLEDETVQASRYPARKKASFPSHLMITGLPAEVLGVTSSHFDVRFLGSGIRDFQAIDKVASREGNSKIAAIEAQVKSLIVSGSFSLDAQDHLRQELEADETLDKSDIEEFLTCASLEMYTARLERLTARFAQSILHWSEFNGNKICDFSEVLHGMVTQASASPDSFEWVLYAEGKCIEQGSATSLDEACQDCATAAGVVIPESWLDMAVWKEPNRGKVVEEIRDEFGNVKWLDVEYESGMQGRISLDFWTYDDSLGAIVENLA